MYPGTGAVNPGFPSKLGPVDTKNWSLSAVCWREVDLLLCPKCSGNMKVIEFIEKPDVIKKILKHLDLWHVKRKPRPPAHAPPVHTRPLFDESSAPSAEDLIIDPQYPVESCIYEVAP
jgi:hypothetical protein